MTTTYHVEFYSKLTVFLRQSFVLISFSRQENEINSFFTLNKFNKFNKFILLHN